MSDTVFQSTKASSQDVLQLVLVLIFFGAGLTVWSSLVLFYPFPLSILSNVLFPIGVLLVVGMETIFGTIKLVSLILPRLVLLWAYLGYGGAGIEVVFTMLVAINLIEAILVDVWKGSYYNAMVGLGLIVTLLDISLKWTGETLIIEGALYWVLVYTIWNWQITLNHTEGPYSIAHIVILLAPLSVVLFQGNAGAWLVMRELTLTLGISILAVAKKPLKEQVYQVVTLQQFVALRQVVFSKKIQIPLLVMSVYLLSMI